MDLELLCRKIALQPEVQDAVLSFANSFEFEPIRPILEDLKSGDRKESARLRLSEILGEDPRQFKMLACMLQCAAEAYSWYEDEEIGEDVYVDTMKCFPRFLEECRQNTGAYAFDRAFWTVRQIGCRLFRLGSLEFELELLDAQPVISVHIPSDADLSPAACDDSFRLAEPFFRRHFGLNLPQYLCHSWLLAPVLERLLPSDSNIIQFQRRFTVYEIDESDRSFLQWVFQCAEGPWVALPEHTSLQRALKVHLLSGGTVGAAKGILSRRTFGSPEQDVHYNERTGAYGICFDAAGNVALVEAPAAHGPECWCFLPGGGIEEGESDCECLRRECLEELGRPAEVGEYLCTGDEYLYSKHAKDYVHVIGRCYRMELGEQTQAPIEPDHTFRRVPVEQCGEEMFLKYQAWAVQLAREMQKKKRDQA